MKTLDDVLSHFGVPGMKWGVRNGTSRTQRKQARLNRKIKGTTAAITSAKKRVKVLEKDIVDLKNNGVNSAAMRRAYGNLHKGELDFLLETGNSKNRAARLLREEYEASVVIEQRNIIRDQRRLDRLNRKKTIRHSDVFDDVLSHFGVPGMKWGVRRRGPKVDNSSEDAKAASAAGMKAKKTGVKSLSNQELQQLVNRMNLEQQLSRLRESQPSKFQRGKKIVRELLDAGKMTNEAIQLAKSPAVAIVKSKIGK